jgi:predicted AAA+ superfamily ATPase
MESRYLQSLAHELLSLKPMLMIGGPRQVGKTTLSLQLLSNPHPLENNPAYLNWDSAGVPQMLREGKLPAQEKIIILDEIHKYKNWRNLIKGFYDTYKNSKKFIITGSAKLDHYRKGGDSLLGRYFHLRLHPLSLTELNKNPNAADLQQLLKWGGFPEPFFKQNEKFLRLWKRQRNTQLIREDLRDLEMIREISLVEQLAETLPSKVGSRLSIKNIKQDIGVDHKTIVRWITYFENLFICFRISPYGSPKIKAIKKDQKLYYWDWSDVENSGARFENLVAGQLYKLCHFIEDSEGIPCELRYLMDTDKHEVDFVVIKNKKPWFAVECKTGEKWVSKGIHYFKERTSIPQFYQVHLAKLDYVQNGVRVLPFTTFCKELGMP